MLSSLIHQDLAGTVGGGFLLVFITGYAIKKVIKLVAVIVGPFIAALAYVEYQRILNVDWHKIQAISQNGIDWVTDALTHISGVFFDIRKQKRDWTREVYGHSMIALLFML